MTNLVRILGALCLGLVVCVSTASAQTWDDEFSGPFPSWANAKTTYGAVGDGLADDTAALQAALNDLGTAGKSSVLYVPAGTYRVTSTLALNGRIHVSIVGADPATTTIRWNGPAGGTLFTVNGVAYSRINRLTFDGVSTAAVLVDQSWTCGADYFDTGNEYADDVFKDAATGLRGGNNGCGFAETSIWRSQFLRLSTAGVSLKNFNALDAWVWYSRFDGCAVGITNYPGAGNFHVYNSYFRNSTTADVFIKNTGGFNLRNNTSIGSAAFFSTTAAFGYPATITIQGNAISTTAATPIYVGDQGPVQIVDNTIVSSRTAAPISVGYSTTSTDGDALIVGNRTSSSVAPIVRGRSYLLDNTTSTRLSVSAPTLPGTPPLRSRARVDVPVGANAATIQQAINTAVSAGSRAVVHLPEGRYNVDTTLTVPANADIQIIGDGQRSELHWAGVGAGPVLKVFGPTHTALRDFRVHGDGTADTIRVATPDQSGSRVYLNQVQLDGATTANLHVSGVDRLLVDARDIGHAQTGGTSIVVVGGPLAAAGSTSSAKVNIFSGASCCASGEAYSLSNGGRLLVRDMWFEAGGGTAPWARLSGRGTFTLAGSRVAISAAQPALSANGFIGRASILASAIDSGISLSGNAAGAAVYAAGDLVPNGLSPVVNDTATGAHTMVSQHLRMQVAGGSSVTVPDSGGITSTVVRNGLAHTRAEQPGVINRLGSTLTDLRLYRVATLGAVVGVRIAP